MNTISSSLIQATSGSAISSALVITSDERIISSFEEGLNTVWVQSIESAQDVLSRHMFATVVVGPDVHFSSRDRLLNVFVSYAQVPFILLFDSRIDSDIDTLLSLGYSDVYRLDDGAEIIFRRLKSIMSATETSRENQLLASRCMRAEKELEEYVYVVSHDLKAPLRGLSTLASFIEEELSEKCCPSVSELLVMMKSRTERMQLMLDGILHYSRTAGRDHPHELVSIKTLINNTLEEISCAKDAVVVLPDELPEFSTDSVKLKEVFRNLIDNGITHNEQPVKRVSISFRDLGDTLEFSITDNGKGIRADHQTKVFGLFHTLQSKDNGGGMGLGLAIVKKIVEQQSGTVKVDSVPGCGSTFTFTWNKGESLRTS